MSNSWQHCRASKGGVLKWDLVSPYREGSAVRSDAAFSPEGRKIKVVSPSARKYNCLHFKSGEQVGVGFIGTDSFNPNNN